MIHRAIFLDRDGTLIHPRHYPSRPEDLHLYAGIEADLRDLQEAGFRLVVITNQAGIARGFFTEADLAHMHAYLTSELERSNVKLDAIYYCPHHPEGIIPEFALSCDCRKPQAGMLLRAAADLHLDLPSSWLVGDILDDVEAGNRVGCRTILVDLHTERSPDRPVRRPAFVAQSTQHALGIIKAMEALGPETELAYSPISWRMGATEEAMHPPLRICE